MTSSQIQSLDTAPASQAKLPRVVRPTSWKRRYGLVLALSDLAVITWAVVGAYVWRIGFEPPALSVGNRVLSPNHPVSYFTVAIVIIALWWTALAISDARAPEILGAGAEEYKRIFRASFFTFGAIAIVAYLSTADIARGFVVVALPAGVLGLAFSRAIARDALRSRRRNGLASTRAVIVGSGDRVAALISELQERPEAGYKVVGACVDAYPPVDASDLHGVPVLGTSAEAVECLERAGASAMAVTASLELGPAEIQQLGWELEGKDAELIMSPSLTSVAGPRIRMRPVSGLPLLHVEGPRLPRSGALLKNTFDRLGSAFLIAMLSPVFIGVAIAVKATSKGPALFFQERIGENGQPFNVFKFRSMVTGADAQLQELLAQQGTDGTPLFKPENDPRITKVGHFIRKYSLDELPQLFNVLLGTMSLVGPRPQRQAEVDLYQGGAERRLLCKPGMTGLWQVSGRSDMPWHKAMRLDLYYVENWSFTFDLLLLWRTVGVVLQGSGAR